MLHISIATNELWVAIASRLVGGPIGSMIVVACTTYVDQNAHPKYKHSIGVLLQVFMTFGIFFSSAMGLAFGQSVEFEQNRDHHLSARLQGLSAFITLFCICAILLSIFMKESRARFSENDQDDNKIILLDPNEYSWLQMTPHLVVACFMTGTMYLTGMAAVTSYSTVIMGRLNVAPLVGNFIVML
uniref:Putative transport protein n=1 Tax=Lygus hesperus TaxID=30085 RepID=A0A0A9XSP7_LYGHE